MGAKQSPEMAKAKKLVLDRGFSQYAAAAAAGITAGAISKTQWWRDYKEEQAAAKKGKGKKA